MMNKSRQGQTVYRIARCKRTLTLIIFVPVVCIAWLNLSSSISSLGQVFYHLEPVAGDEMETKPTSSRDIDPASQDIDFPVIRDAAMSFEPTWSQWVQINYMNQENPPLFSLVADKLRVKDWIAEQNIGLKCAKTLWNSSDASQLTLEGLPESYVIKSNQASATVIPVKNGINLKTKKPVDQETVRAEGAEFLKKVYGLWGELWYSRIEPQLFVEEFLESESGEPPHDYKLHTIHQKVVLIQVDLARFKKHNRHFYNRNWERVELGWIKRPLNTDESLDVPSLPKPSNFDQIITIAEALAKHFQYIRVDLFLHDDAIYFGELTFTHEGGASGIFRPAYLDNILGYLIANPQHISLFQNFSYPRNILPKA